MVTASAFFFKTCRGLACGIHLGKDLKKSLENIAYLERTVVSTDVYFLVADILL